jgi:serine/threonine protein kinase
MSVSTTSLSPSPINDRNTSQNSTDTNQKKYTIPLRIEEIKNLIESSSIPKLVDFDHSETEYFVGGSRSHNTDNDIRNVLNRKSCDFYTIITQIGGKLQYIKSGSTGHTFKGISTKIDGCQINYGVKVVAYSKREKYGNINDVRRPENAELMMIRLLSYFIINKHTPHIVLPIGSFNTSIKPFTLSLGNNIKNKSTNKYKYKRFNAFVEKYHNGEYHDKVSILISEWANNGDLMDYIKSNYATMTLLDWSVIMFQLISTLAVIHDKYPSFRHNDLKPNNILVHKISNMSKNKVFKYTVNNVLYIIPNIGYIIKLWDFDFACIPGVINNLKVTAKWTSKINVEPVRNKYYDIHYFLSTLKLFFPEFDNTPEIPIEIKHFINRIIPEKYRREPHISERGRLLIDDEYITPDNILKTDDLFKTFRKNVWS